MLSCFICLFLSLFLLTVLRIVMLCITTIGAQMDKIDEDRASRVSMEVLSRGNSFSSSSGNSNTTKQRDPNEVMNALRLDSLRQEQGELELRSPSTGHIDA